MHTVENKRYSYLNDRHLAMIEVYAVGDSLAPCGDCIGHLYSLFLKLKLTFSFHTEFVSFVDFIVGSRVCFVNISPSFNKLTLTFVYDFPSTPHPHTHIFPQKYPLASECSSKVERNPFL